MALTHTPYSKVTVTLGNGSMEMSAGLGPHLAIMVGPGIAVVAVIVAAVAFLVYRKKSAARRQQYSVKNVPLLLETAPILHGQSIFEKFVCELDDEQMKFEMKKAPFFRRVWTINNPIIFFVPLHIILKPRNVKISEPSILFNC